MSCLTETGFTLVKLACCSDILVSYFGEKKMKRQSRTCHGSFIYTLAQLWSSLIQGWQELHTGFCQLSWQFQVKSDVWATTRPSLLLTIQFRLQLVTQGLLSVPRSHQHHTVGPVSQGPRAAGEAQRVMGAWQTMLMQTHLEQDSTYWKQNTDFRGLMQWCANCNRG